MRRVAQCLRTATTSVLVERPAQLGLAIVEARAQVLGQFGDDVCLLLERQVVLTA